MAKIDRVQEVSIDLLRPYPNNAKIHGEDQVNRIADSIKEFGFISPCLIDREYNLIAGHGRVMAAKKLNMDSVPCLFIEGLTEAQRKAYILADNRLTELGEWDFDKIQLELEELADLDFDISLTGFELNEEDDADVIDNDYTEESIQPIAKLGDLYQLGDHRLICGDSTDVSVIDRLMGGAKADMVYTDPPYGMDLDSSFGGMSYNPKAQYKVVKNYADVIGDKEDFRPEIITKIFDSFNYCKEIFLWGADYYAELLPNKNKGSWLVWDKRATLQDLQWTTSEFELCWSKNKHHREILRHTWHGLVGLSAEDIRKRVHPTQKPIKLISECIEKFGKDKTLIVDPYGGSGSTLIACEQLNRKCYMCEIDSHYVDVIINRWETFTGKKAVLIND